MLLYLSFNVNIPLKQIGLITLSRTNFSCSADLGVVYIKNLCTIITTLILVTSIPLPDVDELYLTTLFYGYAGCSW